MEELKHLIQAIPKIQSLSEKYSNFEAFNVFKASGFKEQELFHSNFIAYLLNPKSEHKKSMTFLKLFLECANCSPINNNTSVIVAREKETGNGYIDIVIEAEKYVVAIENKIWAGDQPQQLEKYCQYYRKKNIEPKLIYLTPYGSKPSQFSLGTTLSESDILCISYQKTIISWLRECVRLCENDQSSRLRECIIMYIDLIRIIIKRNAYMEDILELIKGDKAILSSYLDIKSALDGGSAIEIFPEIESQFFDLLDTHFEFSLFETDNDRDGGWISQLNISSKNSGKIVTIVLDTNYDIYIDEIGSVPLLTLTNLNNTKVQDLILNRTGDIEEWMGKFADEIKSKLKFF